MYLYGKKFKRYSNCICLRTPIGKLKGIWSKHGAPELGAKVILEVLNQFKSSFIRY